MSMLPPLNGSLGKDRAKHLLKRSTFHITKARIEEFSNYSVDVALQKLTQFQSKKLSQPINYNTGNPWIENDPILGDVDEDFSTGQLVEATTAWWLDEAVNDQSIRSKMTYFLFSFLSIDTNPIKARRGAFHDYLRLLDYYALGNFQDLIYQVTINNLMLAYLDNGSNSSQNPNENFAREVLELFTIGKGPVVGQGDYTNYTEQDIVEAAKLLTGWRVTYDRTINHGGENGGVSTGFPKPFRHDYGQKQFSERFGNKVIKAFDVQGKPLKEREDRMKEELIEFYDMIFSQAETAKYICRKMYRYFVSGKITTEVENKIIEPLANTFREGYNLKDTIVQLLKSQHFYDEDDANNQDEIIGGLVKPPLELALQTLSITHYPIPDAKTEGKNHYLYFYRREIVRDFLELCSQKPFNPPSVAGFPPFYEAPSYDKFWFNSTTIIPRYNLATILLNKNQTRANFNVTTFVDTVISDPSNAVLLVTELIELLFAKNVKRVRLNYFVEEILLDNGSLTPFMWKTEWEKYKSTGNTIGTESALKSLFKALLWSQEYQVY